LNTANPTQRTASDLSTPASKPGGGGALALAGRWIPVIPPLWLAISVPLAFFGAAVSAIYLSGHAGNIAALWPANAIVVATLLRRRPATWLALVLLAAAADVAANLAMGSSPPVALATASMDMFEQVLVTATLYRFGGSQPWFTSSRWMALFGLASVLASAAAALAGSSLLSLLGEAPFDPTWKLWFVADALGLMIVTPLLLSWTEPVLRGGISWRGLLEAALLTGLVAATAYLIFHYEDQPFLFPIFPVIMLATARAGLLGATAGTAVTALIAMWQTLNGAGPIAAAPGIEAIERVQFTQAYIFAVFVSAFSIAIIMAQREILAKKLTKQSVISDVALNNMAQGVCMFDAQDRLVMCNKQYADLYGLPAELTMPGTALADIVGHRIAKGSYRGAPEQYARDRMVLLADAPKQGETIEHEGERFIRLTYKPVFGGGWIATHKDVTEQHLNAARIAHLASHDALTDLPNRKLFREMLQTALLRTGRGHGFAIYLLDVDQFKGVNDTLGHPVGDGLLQQVAARLRAAVREGDLVARLGGDEFAIIQQDIDGPEAASRLASRITRATGEPYKIDGHEIVIGTSTGIALAPGDGMDADVLLQKADLALYRAKAGGRATYRFFKPEMEIDNRARHALEGELRAALANGEFVLHYQPILDLQSGTVSSIEALIRWRHPVRGLILPGQFIPIAEETGLIVPISEWVLREACAEAASWPNAVKLAVNISAAQLKSHNLPQAVNGALERAGLLPQNLEVEVTETVLLEESDVNLRALHKLRDLGIAIALDDFGTGYSSLSYLRRFPFDKIKIDRSFVHDLQSKPESAAIIRATIQLAQTLGMATTGEGVETAEQLIMLRAAGCKEIQGHYISPPLRAEQVTNFITRHNGRQQPSLAAASGTMRAAAGY